MAGEKIKQLFRKDSPYIILFFIILAVITAAKFYVIAKFGAHWWNDSFDYFYYGEKILSGDFISPEAKRTIGYPLFIAISFLAFGIKNNSVAYMQVILGFFSLYIFYAIQKRLGISNKLIMLNLIIFLLGPLSYFELNILSESFSVFCALIYILRMQIYIKERGRLNAFFTIITALLLILTRPQFVFPLLLANVYLFFKHYRKYSIILSVCIAAGVLAYSGVNYLRSNYFGLSSYLGYNIINHTGEYIEDASKLNPQLVKIYVHKREEFKKDFYGNQAFAIWGCIDELYKKMDYDFIGLSKELTRISVYLITTHPWKYAESISKALYKTFILTDEYIHDNYNIRLISVVSLIILIGGTLFLFLIRSGDVFVNFIKYIFFINLISSAMLDIGENYRHIMPLMFILIVSFTSGCYLIRKKVVFEKLPEDTI